MKFFEKLRNVHFYPKNTDSYNKTVPVHPPVWSYKYDAFVICPGKLLSMGKSSTKYLKSSTIDKFQDNFVYYKAELLQKNQATVSFTVHRERNVLELFIDLSFRGRITSELQGV